MSHQPTKTDSKPWEERLRRELQEFANSIVWSNDDGSEKYLGVGNMADWIVEKVSSLVEEAEKRGREEMKKEIENDYEKCKHSKMEVCIKCAKIIETASLTPEKGEEKHWCEDCGADKPNA